jgi:hypothetical protein
METIAKKIDEKILELRGIKAAAKFEVGKRYRFSKELLNKTYREELGIEYENFITGVKWIDNLNNKPVKIINDKLGYVRGEFTDFEVNPSYCYEDKEELVKVDNEKILIHFEENRRYAFSKEKYKKVCELKNIEYKECLANEFDLLEVFPISSKKAISKDGMHYFKAPWCIEL